MKFGDQDYQIKQRLYKSRGSVNQTLSSGPDDRTEPNKAYYVVELQGCNFWVKERLLPDAPEFIGFGTARDEFDRLMRAQGVTHSTDGTTVRAIGTYAFNDNRILMEWCQYPTFESLKRPKLKFVEKMALRWLDLAGIKETFDLSANNILVAPDWSELVLVDFEFASGVNKL